MTKAQKAHIEKVAAAHVADLLLDDGWGDPFKHRDLGAIPGLNGDEGDDVYYAADDYFFVCVKNIAKRIQKESKAK